MALLQWPPSGERLVPLHVPADEQFCPVAVQSLQVVPRLPQVDALGFMHVPPSQQPFKQFRRLQLPPPPEEPLPLDDPDELPLLLPDDDVDAPEHVQLWHDWPVAVQSMHDPPLTPHTDGSRPVLQLPLESQHPPQTAAHPVVASSPAPSSALLASSVAAPSSPGETLPELFEPVPLLISPPLVPPEPLDEADFDTPESWLAVIGT